MTYSKEDIQHALGDASPWHVAVFESVPSTMDAARELAEQHPETRFLVALAHTQSAGLGRHTRSWASPPEGLWLTAVMRPHIAPDAAPQCTLLGAVAVAEALADAGFAVGIKWPNDVLATDEAHLGKKLCGIRAEMQVQSGTLAWVSLGIGINVNQQHFEREIAQRAVSLLQISGHEQNQAALAGAILEKLGYYCGVLETEGFAPVQKRWLSLAWGMGKPACVRDGETEIEGIVRGLDEDGHLLLEISGQPEPSGSPGIRGLSGISGHSELHTVLSGDLIFAV